MRALHRLIIGMGAAVPAMTGGPVQAPQLSFEAAVITPLTNAAGPFHYTVLPNRLDVKNMSLAYLIKQAYNLADHQLSGPDWISERHYDIAATSGNPVPAAEMRVMLQNLLRERFHLATHSELRTEAAYRLVVLPGGPKMKTADRGYAIANSPMRDGGATQLNGPMSMRQLSDRLTVFAGKPVIDATDLDGYFTIALTFASDDADLSKDGEPPAPILTKAVEELGLKMVPGKEPIQILVVDRADAVPVQN